MEAGREAPRISNKDQGSQFASEADIEAIESVGTQVSMDRKGGDEQSVDRATLEKREVRGRVRAQLSGRAGTGPWSWELVPGL